MLCKTSHPDSRNDKCKTIQIIMPSPHNTNGLIYVQKIKEKQIIYVTHQQRKSLNYRLLTWNRHIHAEYGGVKHVLLPIKNLQNHDIKYFRMGLGLLCHTSVIKKSETNLCADQNLLNTSLLATLNPFFFQEHKNG